VPKRLPQKGAAHPGAIQGFATDKLFLDHKNPRLAGQDGATDQTSLMKKLWTEGALDEIALSISKNGFFPEEQLFVVVEDGKHIVVEGNRRLATVKILRDDALRNKLRATDLPILTEAKKNALSELPISIYPDRKSLWAYVGFRHVNGPMTWDSWAKAQYIAQVHNDFHIPLEEIAESIGDKNSTVARLYRGLMVLNQATEKAGFKVEDRTKSHLSFSHLYTGLDYAGFQKHLGISETSHQVDKKHLTNLKELMVWLYGDKTEDTLPIIRSQNPDLKRLDDVLKEKRALDALRSGLGLDVSHQISLGDEVRFREALARIKYDLQQAKGLLLQGYSGESDLLETAKIIENLAESLVQEMSKMVSPKNSRG